MTTPAMGHPQLVQTEIWATCLLRHSIRNTAGPLCLRAAGACLLSSSLAVRAVFQGTETDSRSEGAKRNQCSGPLHSNSPSPSSIAFALSSSRSVLQLQCLQRMSLQLFQSDGVSRISSCHQEVPQRHSRLALRHASLLLLHPPAHPQQQMPREKSCARFRQLSLPLVSTLIASWSLDLSRLRVRCWFAYAPTAFSILPTTF